VTNGDCQLSEERGAAELVVHMGALHGQSASLPRPDKGRKFACQNTLGKGTETNVIVQK